jgi:hypothetical protein
MGYHVTILRTNQGQQIPISLEEVVSVTSSIDGWRYLESPSTFEFHCKDDLCTLWYQDGELWTKGPEEWQLCVMISLAKRLNARVRGDEFETYITENETYQHPDDKSEIDDQTEVSRKYRKRVKIRHLLFRAYQLVAVSFLLYLAFKWLLKNL